jgi:hypothetical protein
MLALPLFVLFGGLTVWGFFSPVNAAVCFITLAVCFATWLLLANVGPRSKSIRNLDLNAMTPVSSTPCCAWKPPGSLGRAAWSA